MQPAISIVVPTFNRRASLQRLLRALAEQTFPPAEFEVVIVDDGSSDGTLEFLEGLNPPFSLVVLQQPHDGPAAARNLGVARANSSLILFLDDDVVPLPTAVAEHLAAHAAQPDAVVIGPMSPPRDWPRPAWVRWEEDLLQVQYRDLIAGKYPCTPRQFFTANASLSRSRFLAAGGFDRSFKRAEDVELAYRLLYDGAHFTFNPRADVMHYAARSFEAWCRTPYQYGRYDVIMHKEKGHDALPLAAWELQQRHPINRLVVRSLAGRRGVVKGLVWALRGLVQAADRVRARRPAAAALSGIFSLLYWQGVCDEFGSREPLLRPLAAKILQTTVGQIAQ